MLFKSSYATDLSWSAQWQCCMSSGGITHAVVQVVEEWEVGLYQRLLPAVEGALQAAVTDAITETRNTGRVALAAYTAVLPERGVALVKRFDGPVQVRHRLAAVHSKPAGWVGGKGRVLEGHCLCSAC